MTDINEWNLTYPSPGGAVDFDFGHTSVGYPFSVQMEIGDTSRSTVDVQHGTDDATLMGRDLAGGFPLTFTLTTLPDGDDEAAQIISALDAASAFAGAWRASSIAHAPGQYAILKNVLRNRYVLGRPRNFSRKNDRLRKGVIEYVARFDTVTPEFYQFPERTLAPARTVNTPQSIGGDVPNFPFVTFTGPFTTANLRWAPGGLLPNWNITINHALASGDTITVDTRAWNRGAYDDAIQPRNGWVGGSRMADCLLYPGSGGAFLFTTTGTTSGVTRCDIEWFDAYAGL